MFIGFHGLIGSSNISQILSYQETIANKVVIYFRPFVFKFRIRAVSTPSIILSVARCVSNCIFNITQ